MTSTAHIREDRMTFSPLALVILAWIAAFAAAGAWRPAGLVVAVLALVAAAQRRWVRPPDLGEWLGLAILVVAMVGATVVEVYLYVT